MMMMMMMMMTFPFRILHFFFLVVCAVIASTLTTTTTTTTLVGAQLSFENSAGINTFCDTGPTAMTMAESALTNGQEIPQYCIPVPANTFPGGQQMDRCYYLFVPDCASGPVPLVLNLHGGDSCPIWNAYFDRWMETSLGHCFALAFPVGVVDEAVADRPCYSVPGGRDVQGLFDTRDCCCTRNGTSVPPGDTQDAAVLRDVIRDIARNDRISAVQNMSRNRRPRGNQTTNANTTAATTKTNSSATSENASQNSSTTALPILASLDATRIYATGHSNGCIGALAVGALFSDLIAGVACHAGGAFTRLPDGYDPIPTIFVQGKKDASIWYQFAQESYWTYAWVHDCKNETVAKLANGTGQEYQHYNCINNASVSFLLLNESGHIPFLNAFEVVPEAKVTRYDTTNRAYQFLSNHSKDKIPELLLPGALNPSSGSRHAKSGGTLQCWLLQLVPLLFFLLL